MSEEQARAALTQAEQLAGQGNNNGYQVGQTLQRAAPLIIGAATLGAGLLPAGVGAAVGQAGRVMGAAGGATGGSGGGIGQTIGQVAGLVQGARSAEDIRRANDLRRQAAEGASQDYASRAPLREAAMQGLLQGDGPRPNLSNVFSDPTNPFASPSTMGPPPGPTDPSGSPMRERGAEVGRAVAPLVNPRDRGVSENVLTPPGGKLEVRRLQVEEARRRAGQKVGNYVGGVR